MKLPDGDWIIATQRPVDPAAAAALPSGVAYLAPGTAVLAPPSRLPVGRAQWRQSPSFPVTPLPAAAAKLSLVMLAEIQRAELLEGRPL